LDGGCNCMDLSHLFSKFFFVSRDWEREENK